MLLWMWGKGPFPLLMGVQVSKAIMEIIMAVPQQVKVRSTTWLLLEIYPGTPYATTDIFIHSCLLIAKKWSHPRCPSADEWMMKM